MDVLVQLLAALVTGAATIIAAHISVSHIQGTDRQRKTGEKEAVSCPDETWSPSTAGTRGSTTCT
jgi:hypothetical protein